MLRFRTADDLNTHDDTGRSGTHRLQLPICFCLRHHELRLALCANIVLKHARTHTLNYQQLQQQQQHTTVRCLAVLLTDSDSKLRDVRIRTQSSVFEIGEHGAPNVQTYLVMK